MVLTNAGEKVKAKTKMAKKDMKKPVPRDLSVNQPYVPPTPFLRHLKKQKDNPYKTRKTVCMIGCLEKIHKKKDLGDERDMDDGWDITIEDVERLRQILTHTIHTLPNLEPVVQPYMPLGPVRDKATVIREGEQDYDIPLQDGVMQPLTPQTVHITPPDDDYVTPATNPILDKHFNEFGNELFDMTGVDENGNFIEVIKELSIKTHVECETFIQKLLNRSQSRESNKTSTSWEAPHAYVPPYVPPTPFPRHLKKQKDNPYKTRKTVCMIGSLEKIHKKKAQWDEGDMDDGWDITIEDVERIRQILTPTIHTLPNLEPVVQPYMTLGPVRDKEKVIREEEQDYDIPLQDGVMQPLTPQTVHITPPDDDYVAPATNPILDKHLNEFRKDLFYMTGVDENGNFIEVIKELSIKTHVECETFIQKLLNRVSQLPKSSNETGMTRREMKSRQRYSSNLSLFLPSSKFTPLWCSLLLSLALDFK
ncbi:hypothetical protein Tco_0886411 [Tanacetum coccineum]